MFKLVTYDDLKSSLFITFIGIAFTFLCVWYPAWFHFIKASFSPFTVGKCITLLVGGMVNPSMLNHFAETLGHSSLSGLIDAGTEVQKSLFGSCI